MKRNSVRFSATPQTLAITALSSSSASFQSLLLLRCSNAAIASALAVSGPTSRRNSTRTRALMTIGDTEARSGRKGSSPSSAALLPPVANNGNALSGAGLLRDGCCCCCCCFLRDDIAFCAVTTVVAILVDVDLSWSCSENLAAVGATKATQTREHTHNHINVNMWQQPNCCMIGSSVPAFFTE